MEVPEWGTAPEEDYPSLLAPDNMPASDNARKKAKRKQKQQQEHLQNLIHAPVHLVSTTALAGQPECEHMPSSPTEGLHVWSHARPVQKGLRTQVKLHEGNSAHSRTLTCLRHSLQWSLSAHLPDCVCVTSACTNGHSQGCCPLHRQKLELTGISKTTQNLVLQQAQPASL